jgi:hypothetical protein
MFSRALPRRHSNATTVTHLPVTAVPLAHARLAFPQLPNLCRTSQAFPKTSNIRRFTMRIKTFSAILLAGLSASCLAQTEMPNAISIGNEGITITSIPPTAVVQLGTNAAPGVWAAKVSIPAASLPLKISCSQGCPGVLSSADPDNGVVKEIDAQQGAVAYDIGYLDTNGVAGVKHIAALTAPLIPPSPGTVFPLVMSNVQPLTGSPAINVLALFGLKSSVLVGGVLSNFNWNMTINGTLLNCTFGTLNTTNDTMSMSCIVPAPVTSGT